MATTKRQLVEAAFSELALMGWVYDLEPEELNDGLMRLDSMMAQWDSLGIRIGYSIPESINGSYLDDEAGVPLAAVEAIVLNLSMRIAASKGKTVHSSTRMFAKKAYDTLMNFAAKSFQQQLPRTTPRGQGYKSFGWTNRPFVSPPTFNPIRLDRGGDIEITGVD